MTKKSRTRFVRITLLVIAMAALAILLAHCRQDADCKLTIVYPSTEQGTIALGRDFYVIGDIDSSITVPDDAVLLVELKDNTGEVIRAVSTSIKDNKDGLNINYGL